MKLEPSATGSSAASTRASGPAGWLRSRPLAWALPLQALLLFSYPDLLDPWRDEWFTLKTLHMPLAQVWSLAASVAHPPLYFLLAHYWVRLPFPGDDLGKLRAMSGLCVLAATCLLYRFWLRPKPKWFQLVTLAFWVLSPCLLLYGRMARSYSLQLALALVTIAAGIRWMERPRDAGRLVGYSAAATVLMYTHYLPGLAIVAAVGGIFAFRKEPRPRTRALCLGIATLMVFVLYLPMLSAVLEAAREWGSSHPNPVHGPIVDQMVRLAWWFVSFSFGESFLSPSIVLGALLAPAVLFALYRGIRARPEWMPVVILGAFFGYLGVSRWTSFPFTPARVLFILPFFLMLVAAGFATMRRGVIFTAALLALYAAGDYAYFARTGYLNKEYCVPYRQIAGLINDQSPARGAVLMVDEYDTFYAPMLPLLHPDIRVVSLEGERPAASLLAGAQPSVIWMLRHTHDTSPNQWVSGLEAQLREGRAFTEHGYLPYSTPELWILTLLRGPNEPRYFYTLDEFRQPATPRDAVH